MKLNLLLAILLSLTFTTGCGAPSKPEATEPHVVEVPQLTEDVQVTEAPAETEEPMPETSQPVVFTLTSSAFAEGEPIPEKYSCKGEDISPPLAWAGAPDGTQSFALIMDDPDAPVGTWDHWLVFNIPAEVRELPENMPVGMKFGDVAVVFGQNSWRRSDYGGPCPPSGTHRYFFKLYALDTTLPSDESMNKAQLEAEMEGHMLAQTELMGTFNH